MLTTIEDLILHIYDPMNGFDRKALPARDRSILFSIASQLKKPLSLTEKQANLAVKIINENKHLYDKIENLNQLLEAPLYKYTFRSIDSSRKIFILNGNTIAVKFPFDHTLNKLLDKIPGRKQYNVEHRCHVYKLNEHNISTIIQIFQPYNFIVDEQILDWYKQIIDIQYSPEDYVPSVAIDSKVFLKNSNRSMSEYFDTNKTGIIAEDIFLAKTMKIFFNNETKESIQNLNISEISKRLLLHDSNRLGVTKYNKQDICMMLQELNTYPILVLVDDDEKEFIAWVTSFIQYGVKQSEISVLFRSDKNTLFNDYIKDQKLNNLVDKNTKIVFIRNKMPKILYKINFVPKVVISNNTFYVHYTSQKMVDSHPLVLYYNEKQHIGKKIAQL